MRSSDRDVASVLDRYRFAVPDFQRPFSWGEEQLEEFWGDLRARSDEPAARHFMGTMVLQMPQNGIDPVLVWDGQQRLATTEIFLSAIRDYCLEEGSHESVEAATGIHRYIYRGDIITGPVAPVLTLGNLDQGTFEALILKRPGEDGRRDLAFFVGLSARARKQDWSPRVIEGYRFFNTRIRELYEVNGDLVAGWREGLLAMVTALLTRFDLIVTETSDENDAFTTFMTLNDRGLGLSAGDLLKNYLLSKSAEGDERRQAAEGWEDMAQSLGGDLLPTYLRHFYMARYGLVSRPRLYKTMVGLSETGLPPEIPPVGATRLLTDFSDHTDQYLRLVSPSIEPGAWGNPDLAGSLQVLEGLKATQWSPLGLAALMVGVSVDQLMPLVKIIESLVVREIAILGKNPNAFEKIFAGAAQDLWRRVKLRNEDLQAALDGVRARLVGTFSPAASFREAFSDLTVSTQRARVLLDALERTRQREELAGAIPDLPVLDVEHIYPKADGPGWPAPGEPAYVSAGDRHRLGNLALLHMTLNRSQRNQPFDEKRGRFTQATALLLTHDLADEVKWPDWTLESIQRRQTELLDLAEHTWPLPA